MIKIEGTKINFEPKNYAEFVTEMAMLRAAMPDMIKQAVEITGLSVEAIESDIKHVSDHLSYDRREVPTGEIDLNDCVIYAKGE